MKNLNQKFIETIELALEGVLSIEEFHLTLPNQPDYPEPYNKIYSDIEDAVEHFPSSFWSNKPLTNEFKNSELFLKLKKDIELLKELN